MLYYWPKDNAELARLIEWKCEEHNHRLSSLSSSAFMSWIVRWWFVVCFARHESEVECKTVRDDLDFKQTLRCVFTVLGFLWCFHVDFFLCLRLLLEWSRLDGNPSATLLELPGPRTQECSLDRRCAFWSCNSQCPFWSAAKVLMAIGGAFNSLSVQHEHDTVQNSEMGPVDLRQCPRMKMWDAHRYTWFRRKFHIHVPESKFTCWTNCIHRMFACAEDEFNSGLAISGMLFLSPGEYIVGRWQVSDLAPKLTLDIWGW